MKTKEHYLNRVAVKLNTFYILFFIAFLFFILGKEVTGLVMLHVSSVWFVSASIYYYLAVKAYFEGKKHVKTVL